MNSRDIIQTLIKKTPPSQRSSLTERLLDRLSATQPSSAAGTRTFGEKARKKILDPIANGFGKLFGYLLLMGGPRLIFFMHEVILSRVSPPHLHELTPQSIPRKKEIFQLLEQFKKANGQECCFLILFSHPESGNKMQLFSLALCHHVFKLGRLLFQSGVAKSYPRFFVAIDPFALDSMNWLSQSLYAGIANTLHIAIDRQPSRLSWLQKTVFLRNSANTEAGFKFVNYLKAGKTVALAQAGGEPQNARLLYTAREFVALLSKKQLEFNRAVFLAELKKIKILPEEKVAEMERRSSQWTERELFLEIFTSILTPASLQSGVLPANERAALRSLLLLTGAAADAADEMLVSFEKEFLRKTPYRERLFHILLERILRPGVPLMIIPLWHDWEKETIQLENPEILWQTAPGRRNKFYLNEQGVMEQTPITSIPQYAKDFTTRHFPH